MVYKTEVENNLLNECLSIYNDKQSIEKFKKESEKIEYKKRQKFLDYKQKIEKIDYSKLQEKLKTFRQLSFSTRQNFRDKIEKYPFLLRELKVYNIWKWFKTYEERDNAKIQIIEILKQNKENENILLNINHVANYNEYKWPAFVINLRHVKNEKTLGDLNYLFLHNKKKFNPKKGKYKKPNQKICSICNSKDILKCNTFMSDKYCNNCKAKRHIITGIWKKSQ